MRLAIVTESFLPRVDGVSRSVSALLQYCRRKGHSAVVVAPGHGPHESEGFPVVRVMGVPALYPGLVISPVAPGLRRMFERFDADCVHLASPAVLGWAAVRAARRAGVPIAAHFQTDVAAYAKHYGGGVAHPIVWNWLKRLHNRSQATYAPTETLADVLRRRGFRDVAVSGRGVDLHQFRPDRPGIAAARERWAPGDVRILCVSRIAPEKDLRRLVALAAANPHLSVLLTGAGPLEAELRRTAPPNVRLSGLLEGDELGDVYSAADVFAFPSPTETFGQVVQEAMASGLPVVGMRAGGVADLVVDGRTGILAEPGGDAWERGVLELAAAEPAVRRELGLAGRQVVEPRSWDAVLGSLFLDYARLRPDRGGRPSAGSSRPPRGRAAAFMDVDRTVLRGSCVLALAAPLTRAGVLSKRLLVRAALSQLRFATRGAGEAGLQSLAQKAGAALAGARVADLRRAGGDAVRTHIAPLIYPGARRLIDEHHARGEPVYLVSSAPEEIVQEVARLVGADGCIGTRAEIVDGVFTGRLLRLVQGREKVRAVHELADRHGLDLRRCVAYGDSASDAPMLAAVGTGVCVNPDGRLAGMARLRGWEVRRLRLGTRELAHPERLAAAG